MLEDVYHSYRKLADQVDWKKRNCNELFFEYINHENDNMKDIYFAAIVCRYWGYAGRIYNQCNRHVTFEECHDCIIDAIRYVLNKRVWENPDNSLYGDKAGPDKALHIAMKREKAIMLSKKSAYKRLSDFNTLSIDNAHEEYNDASEGLLFDFSDEENDNKIRRLISTYFIGDNYMNGFFLDLICYNVSSEGFNIKLVIRELKNINNNYFAYYKECYGADEEVFNNTVKEIKKYTNKVLEIKLRALLHKIKEETYYD